MPSDLDFVKGFRYNFHTSDGTCYHGALYISGTPLTGIDIWVHEIIRVFISPEEYSWADDYDGTPCDEDCHK